MHYCYEVKMGNKWEGAFSIADPDWRRYIGRYISTPKADSLENLAMKGKV